MRRALQWLRVQRADGISTAHALFRRLPKRALAKASAPVLEWLHRDLARRRSARYREALRDPLASASSLPYFVIAVPDILHFLLPCIRLARRHVPLVLVLNGTRAWERRLLLETYPSLPVLDLGALPGTPMPHGLVLDILLRAAGRDFGIHDPDLYVFEPGLYRALLLAPGELAAGAYGVTNPKTRLCFPTTHLLALSAGSTRTLMERHRVGAGSYRRTPARLAPALAALGLGDHNLPKPYLRRYDVLHLLFALGIHEGLRLRALGNIDQVEGIFHVGGVSYMGNYQLDYLHLRFLALPGATALPARHRARLVRGRTLEEARERIQRGGGTERLAAIDALVARLELEL